MGKDIYKPDIYNTLIFNIYEGSLQISEKKTTHQQTVKNCLLSTDNS